VRDQAKGENAWMQDSNIVEIFAYEKHFRFLRIAI
jgi:hypothetical protein